MTLPASIDLSGRFLFLAQDPAIVERQLQGENLTLARCGPLRDNVSTDEITPTTVMTVYDERLGDYPYVGLQLNQKRPVKPRQVREGGFTVVVAGKRYGKGSSRESSPLAELSAGVRLVIAESFERIYRQNAHNLGLLTSTDFGLIDRIAAGEAIALDEFLQGQDALTARIIRAGGLLALSRQHLAELLEPQPAASDTRSPRTIAHKIIDRARVLAPAFGAGNDGVPQPGDGVLLRADWRFSHEYFTGMAAHLMHVNFGFPAQLLDSGSVVAFEDHLTYAGQSEVHQTLNLMPGIQDLARGHERFVKTYGVKAHGMLAQGPGSEGICHAMMAERYVLPGQVVVGTDSHTPHSGSLGALAFGAGATDMANAWVTRLARIKYPKVCRVTLHGTMPAGVSAKDVVLEILRTPFVASGDGIGMVFEFTGPGVRDMAQDDRATLTNMVAEMGGFTGIVAPDDKTVAFLKERRGVHFVIPDWLHSDAGARYDAEIDIDCSAMEPVFAAPGDPGNGVPFSAIGRPVPIQIAYGGSCTAGKRRDFDDYFEVLSWGLSQGLRVADGVSLFLQFGTTDVQRYCESRGMLPVFEAAGARMLMPGCGACANCGPGSSTQAGQVTVSAINRNFPGRSGPGDVWLASPASVAASALAGRLATFDSLRSDAAAPRATGR